MLLPCSFLAGSFPNYEAYLASLPQGLDSYPHCVSKGSIVRIFAHGLPKEVVSNLPDAVRGNVAEPPQMSEWFPFVRIAAITHAVQDQMFLHDDEGLRMWFAEGMQSVLSNSMYSVLIALVSPARLLRTGDKRWTAFHRGLERETLAVYENGARGKISYPPHLVDEILAEGIIQAFERALALSRAPNPVVVLKEWTPEYFVSESLFDQSKPRGAQIR